MDIWVFNEQFEFIRLVDVYESFIWNEKYIGYGDFELYMYASYDLIMDLRQNYYLKIADSDQVMIIEDIEISNDIEKGSKIKFSGRSLESILDRRIIWKKTTLDGSLQVGIKKLIDENIISPEPDENGRSRKIENFIFEDSTDPAITDLTLTAQYTGDNIYEVINKICETCGIGFRVRLNSNNQFVFSLYKGIDRSYAQTINSYVVFSSEFDNIINTDYFESQKEYKNVTLVLGEDKDEERKRRAVGNAVGLARRELYTDARDIQSEKGEGETYTDDEYNAMLDQRGYEKLIEKVEAKAFEGNIEPNGIYVYKKDFFKGDIVQIVGNFGIQFRVRIDEIIRSVDENGFEVYPTFKVMEES